MRKRKPQLLLIEQYTKYTDAQGKDVKPTKLIRETIDYSVGDLLFYGPEINLRTRQPFVLSGESTTDENGIVTTISTFITYHAENIRNREVTLAHNKSDDEKRGYHTYTATIK